MSNSSLHGSSALTVNQPADYEVYRGCIDEISTGLTGTEVPMPRIGIFNKDDYDRAIVEPDTIVDRRGLPLVVPFSTAYPNANLEGYPRLQKAGYIMQPIGTISEHDEQRILDTRFDHFIAEVVATNVFSYGDSWPIIEARLDTLHKDVANSLGPVYDQIKWGTASPFDNDGRPVVHHVLGIDVPKDLPKLEIPPNIVDDFHDKSGVRAIIDGLARHHIDSFSEHSKTASLINLDHRDVIVEMLENPDWNVIAHMNGATVDCAALITRDRNSTPYINPRSIPEDGMFTYVDSISTSQSARREGLALGVLIHALKRYVEIANNEGFSRILVPFDTSGDSTGSVPRLAHAVFEMAGLQIASGRVDVISHVLVERHV